MFDCCYGNGNVIQEVNGLGQIRKFEYDKNGNQTKISLLKDLSVLVGFGAEALYDNFPIVEDTVDAIGDILESLFTKEIDVGPKDRIPAE